MTETELAECVARIEGAQEFMVAELRRARAFGWMAWALLAVLVVAAGVISVKILESIVQQCGWIW